LTEAPTLRRYMEEVAERAYKAYGDYIRTTNSVAGNDLHCKFLFDTGSEICVPAKQRSVNVLTCVSPAYPEVPIVWWNAGTSPCESVHSFMDTMIMSTTLCVDTSEVSLRQEYSSATTIVFKW
jgi:hypothetical protein